MTSESVLSQLKGDTSTQQDTKMIAILKSMEIKLVEMRHRLDQQRTSSGEPPEFVQPCLIDIDNLLELSEMVGEQSHLTQAQLEQVTLINQEKDKELQERDELLERTNTRENEYRSQLTRLE